MKWSNVGHEFDALYARYKYFFRKKIFLFGAGEKGVKYASVLGKYNINIAGVIDNDCNKQGGFLKTEYNDIPIISFCEYKKTSTDNSFIIISVGVEYEDSIKLQLLDNGLIEFDDFMKADGAFEKILRILLMYDEKEIFIPLAQISLTERCTLRCKKCAHACNYVSKENEDLTFDEVSKSMDYFFKYVDYIYEFVLIGGEPFLYGDLQRIIDYTSKYRYKMQVLSITTNGTILPSDEVLMSCKTNDVLIRISNYTSAIPRLNRQYKNLERKLQSFGIKYNLYRPDIYWMDYGFDYFDRKASALELEKVFDNCFTPCHEIRGSKFYFCVMARSVAENMKKNCGSDDYFELDRERTAEDKMKFFEYTMGYSEKGFLDMCNYCHGAEARRYRIPAAEQMDKEIKI